MYIICTSKVDNYFPFSEDVEEQVCPVLLQLTAGESNDDYRSEAVAVSFVLYFALNHTIKSNHFIFKYLS